MGPSIRRRGSPPRRVAARATIPTRRAPASPRAAPAAMSAGSCSAAATRAVRPTTAAPASARAARGAPGGAAVAMAVAAAAWRLGNPPSARPPGRGRPSRSRSRRAAMPAATPAARQRTPVPRVRRRRIMAATARRKAGLITPATRAAAARPPGTAPATRGGRPRGAGRVVRAPASGRRVAARAPLLVSEVMRRALALLVALAASALLAGCSGGGLGGDSAQFAGGPRGRRPSPAAADLRLHIGRSGDERFAARQSRGVPGASFPAARAGGYPRAHAEDDAARAHLRSAVRFPADGRNLARGLRRRHGACPDCRGSSTCR